MSKINNRLEPNINGSDLIELVRLKSGCVCFFHLMLNITFFELNAE